jgi:integrase/recombinase XerC
VAATDLAPELQAFLQHLAVERRLAARTLALYTQALQGLQASAATSGVALMAAQPHHIRGWVVQLRARGLAPRSIALALAAWRGLYAWWGRNAQVAINPVLGVRPPKAARPLPKALPVEQAVALATQQDEAGDPVLDARDHAITELLYGAGLRVAELMGLDVAPSATARGWLDLQDEAGASAHVLGKGSKRRSVPVGAAAGDGAAGLDAGPQPARQRG